MKIDKRYKNNDPKYIGQKFGRLTVAEIIFKEDANGRGVIYWRCACDCGNVVKIRPQSLKSGNSSSCGCLKREIRSKQMTEQNIKHGMSGTRIHTIWNAMRARCSLKSGFAYAYYGGRGIKVCDEWLDFQTFCDWAMAHGYSDKLTLERIDTNGDYCPQNCKWITMSEQSRNKRSTIWVMYDGRRMSLVEAAEIANLPYKDVWQRIKKLGWTADRALSEPIYNSSKSLRAKCIERGLNYSTVYNRIHNLKWNEDRALNTPTLGQGANQTSYSNK